MNSSGLESKSQATKMRVSSVKHCSICAANVLQCFQVKLSENREAFFRMRVKKTEAAKVDDFTPAEQRAARSERVKVLEAEPYGWIAFSESGTAEREYHLFCEPQTKHLACTCAD